MTMRGGLILPDGHLDAPLARFKLWWQLAQGAAAEADAMVLSSVDSAGMPSSRVVYLRQLDHGLVFYTNLLSQKGQQLLERPVAALNFHWAPHERQVRMQGSVESVDDATADRYFAQRPRDSQIGAWASQQSAPVPAGTTLLESVKQAAARFEGQTVPRPPHWSGLRVLPNRIEFWQAGAFRLHRRDLYVTQNNTEPRIWSHAVLQP